MSEATLTIPQTMTLNVKTIVLSIVHRGPSVEVKTVPK